MKKTTISLLLICVAAFAQQKGTFTDSRDKKSYKTVKIGNQTWMAENLNYDEKGSKCYDNKPNHCKKYGRLYNWEAASKACPKGWHLPSKAEYETLDSLVGTSMAGKKLKAKEGWTPAKEGYTQNSGTDEFGFTALPSGEGTSDGKFFNATYYGNWWSATSYTEYLSYMVYNKGANRLNDAYFRSMFHNSERVNWLIKDKGNNLYSVRCIHGENRSNP